MRPAARGRPSPLLHGRIDPVVVREFLVHVTAILHETLAAMPPIRPEPRPHDAMISVLIPSSGPICGVTWSFPRELARDVARAMIGVEDADDGLCVAAAIELANIVCGRGAKVLETRGLAMNIAPPELVIGRVADGQLALLETVRGTVEVVFHLREGA